MTFRIFNAAGFWENETAFPAVPTFSQNLDNLLGGYGVKLGNITEIVGTPGAGKTQLCLQLCASVQVPAELGGLDAEALYIDTNTNFSLTRLREVVSGTFSRIQPLMNDPTKMTEAEALKRVHHVKAITMERYCSLLYTLPHYIKAHPKIKLIVIDSMAQPFKPSHSKLTPKQRTGVLFRHMADLQKVAVQNKIAVVLTNELTTRVGLANGSMVGALGDAWSHRCNVRVLLSMPFYQQDSFRLAMLMKSNVSPSDVVKVQITPEGISDVREIDTTQFYRLVMLNENLYNFF